METSDLLRAQIFPIYMQMIFAANGLLMLEVKSRCSQTISILKDIMIISVLGTPIAALPSAGLLAAVSGISQLNIGGFLWCLGLIHLDSAEDLTLAGHLQVGQ